MASPTGDGGRDAVLFCAEQNPIVVAQYSVSANWESKVNRTLQTITRNHPNARVLLYLSSHEIGAKADSLRKKCMAKGVMIDIRDRSWFIERALSSPERQGAAEQLIDIVARPYLVDQNIIHKSSSPLSSQEARAALVYLGLQWQDDITSKGLTKLSFDALVRAVLRTSTSENRLSRASIHDAICTMLPSAARAQMVQYIDAALNRLTKKYIRHWQKPDEFCLTNAEQERITERLAEVASETTSFHSDVVRLLERYSPHRKDQFNLADLKERVPRILEHLLLKRGEFFVSAVTSGNLSKIGLDDLNDVVYDDLTLYPPPGHISGRLPEMIQFVVRELLSEGSASTQRHLRRLANSYTLFSFLTETPDVQSATRKLFSHGTIWLDTTVLLPFFAEFLQDDPNRRIFSQTFQACNEAGIELRVTSGIIVEIVSHMDRCARCASWSGTWQGRTPFLYEQYLGVGRDGHHFRGWIDQFRGTTRPLEDLAQYLSESIGIERVELVNPSKQVNAKLRYHAEAYWTDAHEKRRADQFDESILRQLIRNDLETYLGVIGLRQAEDVTELGYRHWLLTLDSIAWQIRDRLREEFRLETTPSPLISLSFLQNSLTFGPVRSIAGDSRIPLIPRLLDIEMFESTPHDLLSIANSVRKEHQGLSEFVIRRKVRDAIDRARFSKSFEDQQDQVD